VLHYTSVLKADYSDALEHLLFFNPGQEHAYPAIVDSLKLFGAPKIVNDKGNIRVKVEKLDEVQSLFAMDDDKLVGALVYSRVAYEHIAVIQIVVDNDYAHNGRFAERMLVMRMLELLRSNARRIKGIDAICLLSGNNNVREIPV